MLNDEKNKPLGASLLEQSPSSDLTEVQPTDEVVKEIKLTQEKFYKNIKDLNALLDIYIYRSRT